VGDKNIAFRVLIEISRGSRLQTIKLSVERIHPQDSEGAPIFQSVLDIGKQSEKKKRFG